MSHFTQISTQFIDQGKLAESLNDLGVIWQKDKEREHALIIPQQNSQDLEFTWDGKEYVLVADLMFWDQSHSVDGFLNRLKQRYAYQVLLDENINVEHDVIEDNNRLKFSVSKF